MRELVVVAVIIILLVVVLYRYNANDAENMVINRDHEITTEMALGDPDMQTDKYKIQYRIKGLKGLDKTETRMVISAITGAIDKVEKIITRTTHGTVRGVEGTTPDHITKDVFIDFSLLELDGTLIGQTGVWDYKEFQCDDPKDERCQIPLEYDDPDGVPETRLYYPSMMTVELNKQSSVRDSQKFYNTYKYPWSKDKSVLYYLVLHEVLHGLGIGGLWSVPDIQDNPHPDKIFRLWLADRHNNPYFNGPAWPKYGGCSATNFYYRQFIGHPPTDKSLPMLLENNGIDGTKWWHWEQGYYKSKNTGRVLSEGGRTINGHTPPFLQNEIMVGWDIPDVPPIVSTITIANLEDLGYEVDYSQADAYTLEKANALMSPWV